MDLILVESPTKAKTLTKFLGDGYVVEATMGHIRDLPTKKIGIKIEQESGRAGGYKFEPEYMQTAKQKQRTDEIKKLSKETDTIYLATDPDREGEAIAFHVAELLKGSKSQITNHKFQRIVFHEITKHAIDEALKNPKNIDMPLVEAQQARRILDRLVGYKLSPMLWKKVRRGLSAGRVQSVALRLIVEREREIGAFKPQEFWEILVMLNAQDSMLKVKLTSEIKSQKEAEKTEKDLLNTEYRVLNIEKKEFKRTPSAPFTTSTLQQTAANRLGWSAKKTMQIAQNLYEEGFITYHRTDSTNIAVEATQMVKEFIVDSFGKEYALETPRLYKTKDKVAQEAHEAIRPTSMQTLAFSVQENRDQQKLYDLIWKRFVACQMAEVLGSTTTVKVKAGDYLLQARGETINFMGWQKVYEKQLMTTNDDSMTTNDNLILPDLKEGEELNFISLEKMQKFTQGPARYNDASLIKALEEMGIGRPSTYAPTISTILDRQYVEKEDLPAGRQGKRFLPTSLGIAVNDFLVTNFSDIVDYKFTAEMEEKLDDIANGDKKWIPVLSEFWGPFSTKLAAVGDTAERVKIEVESTGEKCPKCKEGDMIVRIGKFGRFLSCSRFPECDFKGNYQNKTGQKCEKCLDGDVIIRKTRTGRTFYGCSNYPKCDFASWTRPSSRDGGTTAGQGKPK